MNQNDLEEAEKVFKNCEQAIRIFSILWDRRISILIRFYKKKRAFFKSFNQEELQSIFSEIYKINSRERKIFRIIVDKGIPEGIRILENVRKIPSTEADLLQDQTKILIFHVDVIINFFRRYERLSLIHRDILDIEEELLKEWNEDKSNLYMKRIDLFIEEIGMIIRNYKEFERTKQFFDTVEGDIKKLQSLTAKKSPKEYLAPSAVSAVMRVFVSNLVAAATISNPLDNPYFWDLTWRTMISVYFVNFIDYYFNVFSVLTNKTTKLMRLTK